MRPCPQRGEARNDAGREGDDRQALDVGGYRRCVLGAMAAGNAYVNIHTGNFRPGEIRGQIR